jgi:uncharacterized protein DUF559
LPPEDVTVERAIPVTTIERTLLDLAGRLDARQLEHAVVAAEQSGRLRWSELWLLLERRRGQRGLRRLRRVAAQIDPRAADTLSPMEIDFLAICREAGLPCPAVNVLIEGRMVDFYWPKAKLIVETDGYRYHRDRAAFERDHESSIELTVAGYTVHRTTYRMLHRNPDPLLRLLRQDLRC